MATQLAKLEPLVFLDKLDVIEIEKERFTFGRMPNCDHVFSDLRSSSNHASIQYNASSDSFTLFCTATNGTYLNGKKIEKGKNAILKDKDEIKFVRKFVEYKFVKLTKSKKPALEPAISLDPFANDVDFSPSANTNRKRKGQWNDDEAGDICIKGEPLSPPRKKQKIVQSAENGKDEKAKTFNSKRLRAADVRNSKIETKTQLFEGIIALMIAKKSKRTDILMEKFISNGGILYDESDDFDLIKEEINTIVMSDTMPMVKLIKYVQCESNLVKYCIVNLDWISGSIVIKQKENPNKFVPKCIKNKSKINENKELDMMQLDGDDDNANDNDNDLVTKAVKESNEFVIEEIVDQLIIVRHKEWRPSKKIAAFDMDGTLITTKSGNRFPRNAHDFELLYDYHKVMQPKLEKLKESEYAFVAFSNQKCSHLKHKKPAKYHEKIKDIKTKISLVLKKIKFPFLYIASLGDDLMRKPHRGMFEYFNQNFNHYREDQILSNSFYCGDAAGREKGWKNGRNGNADFSSSDRAFAANCKLDFFTPEEVEIN